MSVSVVSCVYGTHVRFFERWWEAVQLLDPKPDRVIVATDNAKFVAGPDIVETRSRWKHPQAWHLHQAVSVADTDWVWVVDIDDLPRPDGLAGLEHVAADVWQVGYRDSDGYEHRAPTLNNDEYLALDSNPYAGGSMFRVDAYQRAGGYPDAAFQDWGLWRRLAHAGATFAVSDRIHFSYMRHSTTRSALELTANLRSANVAEMLEGEMFVAA